MKDSTIKKYIPYTNITLSDAPERMIIDDFLEPQDRDNLFNFITDPEFPYFITDQYTNFLPHWHPEYEYNPKEWRMQHNISEAGNYFSPIEDFKTVLQPIRNKLNPVLTIREKLNMDINKGVPHESNYHVDFDFLTESSFYTAIYYINENNGYTQFLSDGAPVKSKENRLLLFRSDHAHRGVTQTDTERRYVLNLNYYLRQIPFEGKRF